MESSSDRLDDLVARARSLFESKHGPSEGCFAAFSAAKVVRAEDSHGIVGLFSLLVL